MRSAGSGRSSSACSAARIADRRPPYADRGARVAGRSNAPRARGRLRYDYGDHRDPQAAFAWLWRFLDGANSAGELYGRALVVLAAEQHASRLVVTSSRRMRATRWSSHKDIAAKALKKLASPHIPTSLNRLEQAVKRTHREFDKAETPAREQQHAERHAAEPEPARGSVGDELDDDLGEAPNGGCRPPAGRPATRMVARPERACGWRAIGPPAGRATRPKGGRRCPVTSTPSPSPTPSATRAAKLTANASSRAPAIC